MALHFRLPLLFFFSFLLLSHFLRGHAYQGWMQTQPPLFCFTHFIHWGAVPPDSLPEPLGSCGSPGRWRKCSPPLPCLPPFSSFWLSGSSQLLGGGGAAFLGASASGRCFLPSGIAPHSCRRSSHSGSTSLRKLRASCSPPGNKRPRGA